MEKKPENKYPRQSHVNKDTNEWIEEQCRKHGLKYSAWSRWLFTKLRTLEQRGEIDLCP